MVVFGIVPCLLSTTGRIYFFPHVPQVTSVTPHFDKLELESTRVTEFEQNHDVNTFMFETPFTKDGSNKPRAEPCDQWKRRTIITTEYSFPYVKKRLKVVAKREMELSPIEVITLTLSMLTSFFYEHSNLVSIQPVFYDFYCYYFKVFSFFERVNENIIKGCIMSCALFHYRKFNNSKFEILKSNMSYT